MLEVDSRKKEQLHSISLNNNIFQAASELLQLRIMPISENIVRITFRNDENFREDQELGILDQEITSHMSCIESDNEFSLSTETLHIVVEKESGRIIYKDHNDNILFEESKLRPHQLESFEYFKTLPSDNEEIEYIDTPDGKKPLVKNLQKVFDRILYHGKMSFTPADDEKIYGLGQHTEGEFNLRNTTRYLHQANMKVANIGNQFMVGNDMMVCPIYKPMYYGPNSVELHGVDKTREIYFPTGYDWIDLETNQVYDGADGNFSWYLDAGDGYGYENGEYTVVDFTYDNATKQLTISDMEGSYPNMADTRTLQIKFVSEGNVAEVKTISYSGKEITIQL